MHVYVNVHHSDEVRANAEVVVWLLYKTQILERMSHRN
jgi:hypothetical protein